VISLLQHGSHPRRLPHQTHFAVKGSMRARGHGERALLSGFDGKVNGLSSVISFWYEPKHAPFFAWGIRLSGRINIFVRT